MQIGPFELHQPIGEGGMATVWGGVHTQLGSPVAFKFMRPKSNKAKGTLRFLDETRALARMSHPSVVRIFDAGICSPRLARFLGEVDEGSPYFVMEAVSGGDLRSQPPADWQQTERMLLHLLDALAHAHARDVIHRDIKPGNILVESSGLPRLTDFGISRLARSREAKERMTGTPSYMAPEQITGEAHREGAWTDLYAIGCLGYWMVTGNAPFAGSVREVLERHMHDPPPPLSPRFNVPVGLQDWLGTLLEKDPQSRFPRAADAAWALSRLGPAEAIVTTAEIEPSVDFFPTLTVLNDGLEVETSSGGDWKRTAPPIPRTWRIDTTRQPRTQLLSTGPGMLHYRNPPYAGRVAQRDELWSHLVDAWETSSARSIAIEGAPGIGKTALARWFGRRAHEVGAAHTLVFRDNLRDSILLHLRTWWNASGGWAGATAFFAKRAIDPKLDEWDLDQLRHIAAGRTPSMSILKAVHARWMARLGRDRVVLMFCGDDEETVRYTAESARTAAGPRIGLAEGVDADLVDHSLKLSPLDDDTIDQILTNLVGLSPAAARRVGAASQGNPGFGATLAREAARRELLEHTDSGLEIGPEDLQHLVDDFDHAWDEVVGQLLETNVGTVASILANVDGRFSGSEIAGICAEFGADPSALMVALAEAGIATASDGGLAFSAPLARDTLGLARAMSSSDHAAIARLFQGAPQTPRRVRIAAFHSYCAGQSDVVELLEVARALRLQSETAAALLLLGQVRQRLDDEAEIARIDLERAECHLSRQGYAEAYKLLDGLPESFAQTDDVSALLLFLRLRRFEDIEDEILAFEPNGLSETASRMLAYAWMDFGRFDEARELLLQMDAQYDPEGRSYALARLEFLRQNWSETERWGNEAADGFEAIGRLDGMVAALDIVASARLKQGRKADAITLYRHNLDTAHKIGAPTFVQAYNLATCLLDVGNVDEEVDQLLETTVANTIQRKRTDVEHVARAAQLRYACMLGKHDLIRHRLKRLEKIELGPWLHTDSVEHLEAALEQSFDEQLHGRVVTLTEKCRAILAANATQ